MRKCIYCLNDKAGSEFDKEHVVNRAFGTYGAETPTLDCVCRECNNCLGTTIDHKLARGTYEGIERLRQGVKRADAHQLEDAGRLLSEIVIAMPGRLQDVLLTLVPTSEGALEVEQAPQIGFRKKEDGIWINFRLEEFMAMEKPSLPECDKFRVFAPTDGEREEVIERMRQHGLEPSGDPEMIPGPSEEVLGVEVRWHIEEYVRRSIAKIAFNYAAYTEGADFVLKPCFDEVRRFIRHGEGECLDFVRVGLDRPDASGERDHCHFVALELRSNRALIAWISLLNSLTYVVRLTRAYPILYRLAHGLWFDPVHNSMEKICTTHLVIPGWERRSKRKPPPKFRKL